MKKLLFSFLLIFISFYAFGQSKAEAGVFAGVSYYQGDINSSKLFYSPSFSLGAIYRYNMSKHLSVVFGLTYGKLSGYDSDFDNALNQYRNTSFSTSLIDLAFNFEFNFLPYYNSGFIKKSNERFTPYVLVGFGASYIFSGENSNPLTIPFGLGIKYNIFDRFTVGLEWTLNKTFNDNIDDVVNISDSENEPLLHNQDWYSFFGVLISYKLSKDRLECPAYD